LAEASAPEVVVARVDDVITVSVAWKRHASLAARIAPQSVIAGIYDVVEVEVSWKQRLK
jgi:hypothetical protein